MEPFEKEQHIYHRSTLDEPTILSGPFWAELRTFLAVAKAKSFNRAGEILGISHPTVSRQVKRLQDLMGVPLIVPTAQGIILTEHGEKLAYSINDLDYRLFLIRSGISERGKGEQGVVRVSVVDALSAFFVSPSIEEFSMKYPGIHVHIKAPLNWTDIRENQTDIMIGFMPIEAAEIECERLGTLHYVPVASRSYIARRGTPTLDNIAEHYFIHSEFFSAQTGLWKQWLNLCEAGNISHSADQSFSYGMLVKLGIGIGLLPSYVLIDPSSVGLNLDVKIDVPIYILVLRERLKTRSVCLVYNELKNVFGSQNPWFEGALRLEAPPSKFDAGLRRFFNL
jgi:DNA-binding transcriptional LysR family regulator